LADIGGAPMIVRVAERAARADGIDEVAVATDDDRIARAVIQAGFRALMTDPACSNGTMRVAQAARDLAADGYLNVQGAEPLVELARDGPGARRRPRAAARALAWHPHRRGGGRLPFGGRRHAGRSGPRAEVVRPTAKEGRMSPMRTGRGESGRGKRTKYIFVTGGVVSSLGKGLSSASLGALLENRGLKITHLKLDPYINVDPGTMSPFQHGE